MYSCKIVKNDEIQREHRESAMIIGSTSPRVSGNLWHNRLTHYNESQTAVAVTRGLVTGIDIPPEDLKVKNQRYDGVCDGCGT